MQVRVLEFRDLLQQKKQPLNYFWNLKKAFALSKTRSSSRLPLLPKQVPESQDSNLQTNVPDLQSQMKHVLLSQPVLNVCRNSELSNSEISFSKRNSRSNYFWSKKGLAFLKTRSSLEAASPAEADPGTREF